MLVQDVFVSFHFVSDARHWKCHGTIDFTDVAVGFGVQILEEFCDVG